MKLSTQTFAFAALLAITVGSARADNNETDVTTKEKSTQVNGQTGDVVEQQHKQTEHRGQNSDESGARTERSHSHEDQTTVEGANGEKTQVKQGHSSSVAVSADSNGNVNVERKDQHTEEQKTN